MATQSNSRIGGAVDYSTIAESYDATRFCDEKGRLVDDLDQTIVRCFVERSGARRVLDTPTGTGRAISYLRNLPITMSACDLTPAMLERAKSRAGGLAVDFFEANIADIPRDAGSFDCIVCLRFFHLFRPNERRPFAEEFSRLLTPGGYLVCSFTNGWYGGGIGWLKRLLGRRTVQFLYPGEIGRLFPGWKVQAVAGNFFPLHWLLARVGFNPLLKVLSRVPVLRRLCWETFFLLQKPG